MAAISWRRWPDILVDFGHELYIPWQIANGSVLYRDIRHLYGPLSQYANAMLFVLFGASFRVLFTANLLLLAIMIAVLHRYLAQGFGRLTALVTNVVVIVVFGFAQYVGIGNYNYVSPYSHEATHGMALSIALISLLWRFGHRPGPARAFAAGLVLGLVLLTRAEVAVAACAYTGCFLGLAPWAFGGRWAEYRRSLLVFLAAGALPFVVSVLGFWMALPLPEALRAAGGAWVTLVGLDIASNRFFVVGMGLDHPWSNALRMTRDAAIVLTVASATVVACRGVAAIRRAPARVAASLLLLTVLVASCFRVDLATLARPFPLIVLAGLALTTWAAFHSGWGRACRPSLAATLALGVFALALLPKMLLNCRIAQYGFYLALPSVLFICVVLVWLVPQCHALDRRAGSVCRLLAVTVLLTLSGRYTHHSWAYFERKILPIGTGDDLIMSYARDGRGPVIIQALDWLRRNTQPDETFTALPEGIMLNYLTRRRSTSSFTMFMPTELAAFGEDAALRDFETHPPGYILLVHRDTREFGVGVFGRDPRYGKRIMDWVNAWYRPVAGFGAEPFKNDAFGITVLARADGVP